MFFVFSFLFHSCFVVNVIIVDGYFGGGFSGPIASGVAHVNGKCHTFQFFVSTPRFCLKPILFFLFKALLIQKTNAIYIYVYMFMNAIQSFLFCAFVHTIRSALSNKWFILSCNLWKAGCLCLCSTRYFYKKKRKKNAELIWCYAIQPIIYFTSPSSRNMFMFFFANVSFGTKNESEIKLINFDGVKERKVCFVNEQYCVVIINEYWKRFLVRKIKKMHFILEEKKFLVYGIKKFRIRKDDILLLQLLLVSH